MLTKLFAAGLRAATPAAKALPARQNPGAPGIPSDSRRLLSEISANYRFWSLGLTPVPMANPDTLASRKGLRIYEEMRTDDQVKAALALKKLAVTSSGWLLEPAETGDEAEGLTGDAQKVADFAEYALSTMDASVEEVLLQVLTALDFGFSVSEVIFRPLAEAGPFKGKIGLRNVKTRRPHDFWFEVDPFDNLLEHGVRQFERRYPVWKFLIYSHQKEFGNWYGRSDLRESYRPWWFKDNVLKWWSMFLDRYSIPLAEGVFDSLGGNDGAIADMRTALDNLQAATSITHSKDYELKFPTAGISAQGSQTFEQALEAADRRIARAILLPNLLGVSAQADTGSYSQSKVHFDVFMLVVEKLRQDLAQTVMTDQLLRRLVAINYGSVALPTFKFKPFTETNKAELLSMFNQAVASGVAQPRAVDEVHVREITEFPDVPLEEIVADAEAKAEASAAQAAALMPGAPGPGGQPAPLAPGEPEVGAAEHPLTGQVAEALAARGVRVFAQGGQEGIARADIDAALQMLAAERPELDDDALAQAAVAMLVGDGDLPDDAPEELSDEELQALVDEVLAEEAGAAG